MVVATNHDVVQDVQAGTFRKDLYYRLRAHHLQLPPLRARRDDLTLLVPYCLAKAAAALHKPVPTAPLALYQLLHTYAFPGNVRELEAMVFDAVARHQGGGSLQAFKEAMGPGNPCWPGSPGPPWCSPLRARGRQSPPHPERGRRGVNCRGTPACRRQSRRRRRPAGGVTPGVE